CGIWLGVTRRRPVPSRLHLRRVAEVVIEGVVLLDRDHEVLDRWLRLRLRLRLRQRLSFRLSLRGRRSAQPERASEDGDAGRTGLPQERSPRLRSEELRPRVVHQKLQGESRGGLSGGTVSLKARWARRSLATWAPTA